MLDIRIQLDDDTLAETLPYQVTVTDDQGNAIAPSGEWYVDFEDFVSRFAVTPSTDK